MICVYRRSAAEAPARVEEIHHAQQEGIDFQWLTAPLELLGDDQAKTKELRAEIDAMRAVVAAASTWCGATTDPPAVRDFGAAGELVWSVYRYRKAMAKGKA